MEEANSGTKINKLAAAGPANNRDARTEFVRKQRHEGVGLSVGSSPAEPPTPMTFGTIASGCD